MKKRAVKLEEKGSQLLSENDFQGAEKAYQMALEIQEDLSTRNNLALAIFAQDDPKRALQSLEPNLIIDPSRNNPFSYALAAQILSSLNREEEARLQLKQAIELFETRVKSPLDKNKMLFTREYTVIIMKAAASLNDHHLVYDLYRRWKSYHTTYYNRYLAGIAAFNLGQYTRAASLWSSIKELGEKALLMQQVALLVERGVVPPFSLEYQEKSNEKILAEIAQADQDEEARARIMESGMMRMLLLSIVISPNVEEKMISSPLETLIVYSGSWGKELGLNIIKSTAVPDRIKYSSASCLVQCGALPKDAPVSLVLNGKETQIEIRAIDIVSDEDPKVDAVVAQAKRLKEEGQFIEAIDLLKDYLLNGKFHASILMVLSNLYRATGELDEALLLLNNLEGVFEDEPGVMFNLAALYLQKNDLKKARQYFERIDPTEESRDFKDKYRILEKHIQNSERSHGHKAP